MSKVGDLIRRTRENSPATFRDLLRRVVARVV